MSVVATIAGSKSPSEPGRGVFCELLRRIERGVANAVQSWKLDRLARNFDDGEKIIGLLQRAVIAESNELKKIRLWFRRRI